MIRATLAMLMLLAAPAMAQTPPANPTTGGKDVPMARLLVEGAQVRGVDTKDRLVLQFGRFVFLCRTEAGKPSLCDVVQ